MELAAEPCGQRRSTPLGMRWGTLQRVTVALLCVWGPSLAEAQPPDAGEEESILGPVDGVEVSPCTCDCCEVAERLPSEIMHTNASQVLDYKCARPLSSGEVAVTDACPTQCQGTESDEVLEASSGALDYNRYCTYKCKPAVAARGGMCVRLDFSETEEAQTLPGAAGGGNGRESMAPPVTTGGLDAPRQGGYGDLTTAEGGTEAAGGVAEAAVVSPAEPEREKAQEQQVTWDMRKLISERLRAEAGASMAHSAEAAERVRQNNQAVAQNGLVMKSISEAVAPLESSIDDGIAELAANKTEAQDFATQSKNMVNDATALAKNIASETRKITIETITAKAEPAAKEEAEAFAHRMGWDMPDNYDRIIGNRASEPYLKAMVGAIQRVSEYEAYSKTLLGQARAAQQEAQGLASQANAMEAQGDPMGAASERLQIRNILAKSRNLEADANKYWHVADDTRMTVPEWQDAGSKASVFAGWAYAQARTTTPPAPVGL